MVDSAMGDPTAEADYNYTAGEYEQPPNGRILTQRD